MGCVRVSCKTGLITPCQTFLRYCVFRSFYFEWELSSQLMFICFFWQGMLGEGIGMGEFKFLCVCVCFVFAFWRKWVAWVGIFNDAPPPFPSLQRQEARHGQLVPWTDTGAEAVGGGEPRIITGFWSIRPCLTQALVKKTALYGRLMAKLNTRQAGPSLFLGHRQGGKRPSPSPMGSEKPSFPKGGELLSIVTGYKRLFLQDYPLESPLV